MAKSSMIAREKKRSKLVEKYAAKRAELKAQEMYDNTKTYVEKATTYAE